MDRLSGLLPKVLHRRGLHRQAQAALVTHQAEAWLRERLPHCADALRVTKLAFGELVIEVENSIAAQECQQEVPALLAFLASAAKDSPVREVRIMRA